MAARMAAARKTVQALGRLKGLSVTVRESGGRTGGQEGDQDEVQVGRHGDERGERYVRQAGSQEVDQDEVRVDHHGDGQGRRQARPFVHHDDSERRRDNDEGAMELVGGGRV